MSRPSPERQGVIGQLAAKGCLFVVLVVMTGVQLSRSGHRQSLRHDQAYLLAVALQGSWQNPAFSPDSRRDSGTAITKNRRIC